MKDWQSQAHVKWDCKYHVRIRQYIRDQEKLQKDLDQGNELFE